MNLMEGEVCSKTLEISRNLILPARWWQECVTQWIVFLLVQQTDKRQLSRESSKDIGLLWRRCCLLCKALHDRSWQLALGNLSSTLYRGRGTSTICYDASTLYS